MKGTVLSDRRRVLAPNTNRDGLVPKAKRFASPSLAVWFGISYLVVAKGMLYSRTVVCRCDFACSVVTCSLPYMQDAIAHDRHACRPCSRWYIPYGRSLSWCCRVRCCLRVFTEALVLCGYINKMIMATGNNIFNMPSVQHGDGGHTKEITKANLTHLPYGYMLLLKARGTHVSAVCFKLCSIDQDCCSWCYCGMCVLL